MEFPFPGAAARRHADAPRFVPAPSRARAWETPKACGVFRTLPTRRGAALETRLKLRLARTAQRGWLRCAPRLLHAAPRRAAPRCAALRRAAVLQPDTARRLCMAGDCADLGLQFSSVQGITTDAKTNIFKLCQSFPAEGGTAQARPPPRHPPAPAPLRPHCASAKPPPKTPHRIGCAALCSAANKQAHRPLGCGPAGGVVAGGLRPEGCGLGVAAGGLRPRGCGRGCGPEGIWMGSTQRSSRRLKLKKVTATGTNASAYRLPLPSFPVSGQG